MERYKLKVDDYDLLAGEPMILCYCYIPEHPTLNEAGSHLRLLTTDEVYEKLYDEFGDDAYTWLDDNKYSISYLNLLADIINDRESRTETYKPDSLLTIKLKKMGKIHAEDIKHMRNILKRAS